MADKNSFLNSFSILRYQFFWLDIDPVFLSPKSVSRFYQGPPFQEIIWKGINLCDLEELKAWNSKSLIHHLI
jgi:hypothetical protein